MSALTGYVRSEVVQRLKRREQSVAHRFDHIERVMRNALMIAATVDGVDYEILELAVLLHDIDQPVGRKAEHVALSMKAAETILQQSGCPVDRASYVLNVISQHSTEHAGTALPSTIEAKILFDADKLDGLGAVGISRVFSLFGQMNLASLDAIQWYRGKIDIALKYIQTDEGRRLCESRLAYVQEFLTQMESEARADSDIWHS